MLRHELTHALDSAASLAAFVATGPAEGVDLDFKQAGYAATDEGKRELRRDATAFANAGGGALVIGVEEREGRASAICGIASAASEADRMRNVLCDLIEPPLRGLNVGVLADGEGRAVAVVRVEGAESGHPHGIKDQDRLDFWIRRDARKQRMSYLELRATFMAEGDGAVEAGIEANAISEIRRLRRSRDRSDDTPEPSLVFLAHLKDLHEDPVSYSARVRVELIEAGGCFLEYARGGVWLEVVDRSVALMQGLLPSHRPHLPTQETAVIDMVAGRGYSLAYDAATRLRSDLLVTLGAWLMGEALRIARGAGVTAAAERITDDFDTIIEVSSKSAGAVTRWLLADRSPNGDEGVTPALLHAALAPRKAGWVSRPERRRRSSRAAK